MYGNPWRNGGFALTSHAIYHFEFPCTPSTGASGSVGVAAIVPSVHPQTACISVAIIDEDSKLVILAK
jgi:hypothetical protein